MTSHELKMAIHENLNSETGRFRLTIFPVFFLFFMFLTVDLICQLFPWKATD